MRVRLPDVGQNLALDELELVEIPDRRAAVADGHAPGFLERRGIEKPDGGRSVAHDQPRAVVRQAPAFTRCKLKVFVCLNVALS